MPPPVRSYARHPTPGRNRSSRIRPRRGSFSQSGDTRGDSRERDTASAASRRSATHPRRRRPLPMLYVDNLSACRDAVNKLSLCARIAVDCEGVALSRTGRLCLLQVASQESIYVFDLIGPDATNTAFANAFFDAGGLKDLLESTDVCKVTHDCRHDSDALFHQFGVKLGPVIDTQVVFSVLRRVRGMPQGLPVSMKTLLRKFSGASEEELTMKNAIKDTMQENGDFWINRPLSHQALQYARLDVEYLLSITHLLAKYIDGADKEGWQTVLQESQEYLTVFRDDEDGPRKAQQQYEQMARVARRQRVAHEHIKRIERHQSSDPMRKFEFDHTLVLQALAI